MLRTASPALGRFRWTMSTSQPWPQLLLPRYVQGLHEAPGVSHAAAAGGMVQSDVSSRSRPRGGRSSLRVSLRWPWTSASLLCSLPTFTQPELQCSAIAGTARVQPACHQPVSHAAASDTPHRMIRVASAANGDGLGPAVEPGTSAVWRSNIRQLCVIARVS